MHGHFYVPENSRRSSPAARMTRRTWWTSCILLLIIDHFIIKSTFLNRKSGFLDRKLGFFHWKLTSLRIYAAAYRAHRSESSALVRSDALTHQIHATPPPHRFYNHNNPSKNWIALWNHIVAGGCVCVVTRGILHESLAARGPQRMHMPARKLPPRHPSPAAGARLQSSCPGSNRWRCPNPTFSREESSFSIEESSF